MPTAAPELPKAEVLGYQLAACTLEQAAERCLAWCLAREQAEPKLVVTLNPEIIVQARADPELWAALQAAALTVADGVGVVWAARQLSQPLPERVPGVELVTRLLELGGPNLRVYFLGARPGVAARAARAAQERFGTSVAGAEHGYFDREAEAERVVAAVRASHPDLLLAGLGEGQERFLHQHRAALGSAVMIGVGGTLDVLSGEVERSPAWTRRLGLEWAYRVGLDRRRWHRFPRLLAFARLVLHEKRKLGAKNA